MFWKSAYIRMVANFAVLGCLNLCHPSSAFGADTCSDLLGPKFLHQRNTNLHRTQPVERAARRVRERISAPLEKPVEKIDAWLQHLEGLYAKALENKMSLRHIKTFFYRLYVIKPDKIPESYFQNQIRIAREQGHGNIVFDKKSRQELATIVIEDQRKSLDDWIEYLFSADSKGYPMWAKYWAITSVVKLSKFNLANGTFGNRGPDQVAPFPELNRKALAVLMDVIIKKTDPSANFGKMYGQFLLATREAEFDPSNVKGKWVTYPQGSDHLPLVESLRGRNTGWCTAAESTARNQVARGDFHVYYSEDENGRAVNPRLAIRMEGGSIAEVRGVAESQNLDPEISRTTVLEEKLKEFGKDGDLYRKKSEDMKKLTAIEQKHFKQAKLTSEELRFLYELDHQILGFGYKKDPRIAEIRASRNPKADIRSAFNFTVEEHEISLTPEEALRGGIKIHFGDLYIVKSRLDKNVTFPKIVSGNLALPYLMSAEGLVFPEEVYGSVFLSSLSEAQDVSLPRVIHQGIGLGSLKSIKRMTFPLRMGGDLDLLSLESADRLVLPEFVGGNVVLKFFRSANFLVLPKFIDGSLFMQSLDPHVEFKMPERIRRLTVLPERVSDAGTK